MPDILQSILFFLAGGTVAGVLAGLLGVGGGIVIVPIVAFFLRSHGADPSAVMHVAIGTSLATIVVTSISSIRAHHRRGAVNWNTVRRLAPGIVVGTWIGAAVVDVLPSATLRMIFALFLLSVSVQMAFGLQPAGQRQLPGTLGCSGAGALIGAVSGIVGIGGGSLTVPFLSWCNTPIRNAVATSAACGLPIALAGTLGFIITGWNAPLRPDGCLGYISLPAWLGIASASMLSAPLGAKLAHTLPTAVIKRIFAALLCLIGMKMLLS